MLSTSYYPWDLQTHNVHSIVRGRCHTQYRAALWSWIRGWLRTTWSGVCGISQVAVERQDVLSLLLLWHHFAKMMIWRWCTGNIFIDIHRPLRPLVHPRMTTARHTAPLGRFIMARSTELCWTGQLWHFNESLNPHMTRLDVLSRGTRVTGILFSSCHFLWTNLSSFVWLCSHCQQSLPFTHKNDESLDGVCPIGPQLLVSGQVCKVKHTPQ